MRKNLDKTECKALLAQNYIGRLAYVSGGYPHIVPITYFYDSDTNTITSYSSEGHKIHEMRKNKAVCLFIDEIASITNWKSVLLQGTFEELSSIDAKHMLHEFSVGVKKVISDNYGEHPKYISEFSAKIDAEDTPIIFRIHINEITGKIRQTIK
ncbi:pyridoxamine 5'-phosphate oxidase family protein [Maribacter hydrothermalis]|uniref:Flavin mononucleotide-binding protein n=1 Tax=Maribacter hydrothermalis TaxID=1836467 RepID=A0A1B7YYW9_9FLAO|nr:pyridoxamine 5'-phosphate oxidase family protein [Maribacter hydrothermalis]APQ16138.1 flavin mononucleotide-binding protein [Maribacter hydrothermalis]OBR35685.1 flavin mononucleotide-binding protein [Maribacter hydrothermalis]